MTAAAGFRTARLILRQWRDSDREPFAAMGADPEVMQYFPSRLSRAASDAAVDRLRNEIVAYAVLANRRSRAVMERIGMRDVHEDFDHPALPEGDSRRRHCLYRITRDEWRRAAS